MKLNVHLLLFCAVLIRMDALAQNTEHYFRFIIHNTSEIDRLTRVISIDDVRGDTVYAYANEKEWATLHALGYHSLELPHPGSEFQHQMSNEPLGILDWDRYPTYQAYLSMMRQFEVNYPALCRLDTIGYSVQGRQLLAVKISNTPNADKDAPEFFCTSTMHGDETVGYVLLLRLADYLLTQYGQPTPEGLRVTNLVNNMEIWINPLANPDGTYRLGSDTTVSNARRYNFNGIDLNRNFPDRIDDTVNTGNGREAETRAFMEFANRHNVTLSANFHGGAQVVNYPWDNGTPSGTYSICPDDQWFIHLSRAYATPNPDLMNGGFTNGITNGCAWYAIYGGRQDWMYWWHGGRETTIELYNTKNPSGSLLPQRWLNNKESFLAYMEETLKGIRGIALDTTTRRPLRARIDVMGIANAPVFTDSAVGDYHRLLLPGTYSIIAQAPGYFPDTTRTIVVTDSTATRVDFFLRSTATDVSPQELKVPTEFALLQNYPNPFNPTTNISFTIPASPARSAEAGARRAGGPHSSFVILKVFDMLGREVATLAAEEMVAGRYEKTFDGGGVASGVYFYRLQAGGLAQSRKLLLLR